MRSLTYVDFSPFGRRPLVRDELLDGDDNVLLDQTIRLTGRLTKTKYPSELRRIVYYAPELKRTFTFLTNDFTIKAKNIAMLYKQRWQVELFKTVSSCALLLGNQRERRENTDICCSHHILPRGHRRARLPAWKNNVQCLPSTEQSPDRQDPHQRPFQRHRNYRGYGR